MTEPRVGGGPDPAVVAHKGRKAALANRALAKLLSMAIECRVHRVCASHAHVAHLAPEQLELCWHMLYVLFTWCCINHSFCNMSFLQIVLDVEFCLVKCLSACSFDFGVTVSQHLVDYIWI